ncbi:3'(2'),5'-bisphosphate nucleotidase CysQ [Thiomicrorhabdus sp.]|uniref:3'(2'),5'-bisphosphate nucleotidase CysQ n=1 Tax=Thiomicrorhabdus sp. TaxID=2039724 RepID=UPI0029C6432E|nr:3'(2'),5'-bisphosphate nucleotidase CysQ [Thiomicrorhabdus sp.]
MDLTPSVLRQFLPALAEISCAAGNEIMRIYQNHLCHDCEVEQKSDGTPVTEADKRADQMISEHLARLTPDIPIISEESVFEVPFEKRHAWSRYWLIDPLDGTKEFIEKTGEFSVNIALIDRHHPCLGVVYAPASEDLYLAVKGEGAYKLSAAPRFLDQQQGRLSEASLFADLKPISCDRVDQNRPMRVAVSRRHGALSQRYFSAFDRVHKIKMGSALKTCLVAEGRADVYPRFGPTSLWDTAASQCVLEAAGGAVLNAAGHALEYVQTESLLNPFFIAVGDPDYPWPTFPEVL